MSYVDAYGPEKRNIREAIAQAREKHLKPLMDQSKWHAMHSSPLPKELHQTTYITDTSLDFMNRHLKNHQDKPFIPIGYDFDRAVDALVA